MSKLRTIENVSVGAAVVHTKLEVRNTRLERSFIKDEPGFNRKSSHLKGRRVWHPGAAKNLFIPAPRYIGLSSIS